MDLITGIIFFIVFFKIIQSIVTAKKKAEETKKADNNYYTSNSGTANGSINYPNSYKATTVNPVTPSRSSAVHSKETVSVPVQTEQAAGQSTTDYLAQKAYNDKQEHDKENKKAEMKAKQFSNGSQSAERLLLGDSIPNGKRRWVCRYCGADNLLPENARESYNCYFCREPL